MRRLGLLLAALALAPIAPAGSALAAGASWQLAPASIPPPPPGVKPVTEAVPLGRVGDISFWAPNRGLLIDEGTFGCTTTSSTATVPCGLYAYNGEGWHLLSSVCGAGEGRIAWAGPDEFWTISDQRPGQFTGTTGVNPKDVSLCHFKEGKVIASYATPFGLSNSYRPMFAAACLSPSNCWFGGELGREPNKGAFHLHWDGQSVTAIYSPQDHAVASMALADGSTLFETVALSSQDEYGSEDPAHPGVLHQIDPPGSSIDFHNLLLADGSCVAEFCPPLPKYGTMTPATVAGLSLSSDYTPSGSNPGTPQVWAAAGPRTHSGSVPAGVHAIALRYSQGTWTQAAFSEGGKETDPFREDEEAASLGGGELFAGMAAEPGSPAAWLSVNSHDKEAHLDRLTVNGKGEGKVEKGKPLGEAQKVGKRGEAGPIACPAPNDCWMATSAGWLFHLTEDAENPTRTDGYPVDTDPNFGSVITFRPTDEGVPQLPPTEPPVDDSLANLAPPSLLTPKAPAPANLARKALVTDVSSHVVHRYTLQLSFRLTVKARVQLLASRKSRRVAQTALKTLKAGKHMLMLRLDPRRWPNKLDLKATPLEALPTVSSPAAGGGTVPPPAGFNSFST